MINFYEVVETNQMIEEENLDVRTITLGISLMDCIDSDLDRLNEKIYKKITTLAKDLVSLGNQTGEGWLLTGEMIELIHNGAGNIVCCQPFACLPNHIVGKGVIKELRAAYPEANIIAVDYDPGASEVNQLNRIKLMLSTANKNLAKEEKESKKDA